VGEDLKDPQSSDLHSAVVARIRDAAAAAATASDAYKRFDGSSDGESIIPPSTTSTLLSGSSGSARGTLN